MARGRGAGTARNALFLGLSNLSKWGHRAGVVVMSAQERKISQHYCQELEKLVETVQALSFARDLDRIGEIVRHEARELTGADGATFVLRDGDYCYYADEEAISPLWKGQRFPVDRCISGWVMEHGQPVAIEDIYSDARIPSEVYRPTFVRSLVMVPLRPAEPVGAIGTYWSHLHRPTDEEVQLLQALANTTAVAIENVRLVTDLEQRVKARTRELECEVAERHRAEEAVRQIAISDELTGLLNRRGFFLQAEQELKVARRLAQKGLLLFVDLDGLKLVNDTLGHSVGDRMICDAADVLRHVFRDSDVLARFGGDEFAAFTLDGDDDEALRQRLRNAVDAFNASDGRPYRLSISVGLAAYGPSMPDSLEHLIELADAAMYREKRAKPTSRTPQR